MPVKQFNFNAESKLFNWLGLSESIDDLITLIV